MVLYSKNQHTHITNICTCNSKYILLHKYIYSKIYTNTKAERVFMTRSFRFYIQKNIFCDMVISLVLYSKVLQCTLSFPFLSNQQ